MSFFFLKLLTISVVCSKVLWLRRWFVVFKMSPERTSLVVQWLRIHLPVQGTWVWSLIREDPTCRGAAKPERHNYWACALEPASHNYGAHVPQLLKPAGSSARVPQLLSPRAATTEARAPRAHAPQQEKPLQWEACAPQRRVAPARHN